MRRQVHYKMFARGCLFGLLATVTAAALAERSPYWAAPRYVPQELDKPVFDAEATNPWHISDKKNSESTVWSLPADKTQPHPVQQAPDYPVFYNQTPNNQSWVQPQDKDRQGGRYVTPWSLPADKTQQHPVQQAPDYPVPYSQTPNNQSWMQPQNKDRQGGRYVTPEIIETLNRQEAQFYSQPMGEKEYPTISDSRPSLYDQRKQEYPAYPVYGMGGADPLYGAPSASPWGNAPDVLYRGEGKQWMPDETIGEMPPIHVPMFGGSTEPGRVDDFSNQSGNNVFNPYTFLHNKN